MGRFKKKMEKLLANYQFGYTNLELKEKMKLKMYCSANEQMEMEIA